VVSATGAPATPVPRLPGVVNPEAPSHRERAPASDCAVTLSDVCVRYGSIRAVNGLDLDVPAGQITALLGPNGAGKSTTVAAIAGLVTPDSGHIEVLGGSPGRFSARCDLGVMLQEGGIPTGSSAESIVKHHAALRGAPHTAEAIITELGLKSMGRTTYRRMSGGQKRLVALGCALVGNPTMVIVDEPTAGLDPQARRSTWAILHRLRDRGVTVLLCTHDLDEAERLGDHIAIIDAGALVIQGSCNRLLGSPASGDAISFEGPLHLDVATLRGALPDAAEVREVVPGLYQVSGSIHAEESATITAWAIQHGVEPHRIRPRGSTLEDLYFHLIGQGKAGH
jgi:ABC-2 type transport system ATP-binding protein